MIPSFWIWAISRIQNHRVIKHHSPFQPGFFLGYNPTVMRILTIINHLKKFEAVMTGQAGQSYNEEMAHDNIVNP